MIGKVLNLGMKSMTILQPALQYSTSRKQGKNILSSVGSAGLDYITYSNLMGPLGWFLMGGQAAVGLFKGANEVGKTNAKVTAGSLRHNFGGNFQDSNNAYTMRQRGIQAIQNNGLNARSVLGSEARQYFRSGL